jgi:hypothetical protein
MIRVSIGAEATERRHVEAVWAALQDAASVELALRARSVLGGSDSPHTE